VKNNDYERFTVCDPRGRSVTLREERYEEHIVAKHNNISVDLITDAVENPDYIVLDKTYREGQNYYKGYQGSIKKELYTKVVVAFQDDGKEGDVVTSHLTGKVDAFQSGWIVWPKI